MKQGRSYFRLLQKEEQEAQEEQRRELQKREELRRTKLQPPTLSDPDEDSDTQRCWHGEIIQLYFYKYDAYMQGEYV